VFLSIKSSKVPKSRTFAVPQKRNFYRFLAQKERFLAFFRGF